jgi:Domain of unknown function (DUF4375)
MSQLHFRRLSRALLGPENQSRLFELAAKEITAQIEDPPHRRNPDRAAALPCEARTVYWLWHFFAEAQLGGMEVFILEPEGLFAPQIHAALVKVGATELVRRLEAAIPLAREDGVAEFSTLPDQSWFEQFRPVPDFPTFESIDAGVFPLIQSMTDAAAAFIRSHENALFEP